VLRGFRVKIPHFPKAAAAGIRLPSVREWNLELRNAIRLKHGRAESSAATMRAALKALESDLAKGVLARPGYDLDSVYRRAETLSVKHAADTLARAADIWHVAAALEIGCEGFSSFDERQGNFAALAGLKLTPRNPANRRP